MNRPGSNVPIAIAIVAGAILWVVGSAVSDRREAWDSGVFWAVFYPASIVVCAVLGYVFPERPWRWSPARSATWRHLG